MYNEGQAFGLPFCFFMRIYERGNSYILIPIYLVSSMNSVKTLFQIEKKYHTVFHNKYVIYLYLHSGQYKRL